MILEVCCGNLESADAAVRGGAQRIELCSRLEVDGLTPSWEDLRTVRARYPGLCIHVLIRPRPGDFCYSGAEIEQMEADIETALDLGADGVVVGALTPRGDVDTGAMLELTCTVSNWAVARMLEGDLCHASNDSHFFRPLQADPSITFHRAFDVCRKPFDALEDIIRLGCDRILTSGQSPRAVEGTDLLRELRLRARGEVIILPGGGVTPGNIRRIVEATGCIEIHASASVTTPEGVKITQEETVRALLEALQ